MHKSLGKKIGIWAFVVALFMAHIFFRSVAHADEGAVWKQIYTKSGECRIDFPVVPQLMQQSLKLSESGHRLNYDVYLAPFENKGVFLLLIATYPLPLTEGHEIAGLDGLLKGIIGHHPDNQLMFAKQTELHGHPSLDFLVQNGTSYFRGHALMVGNKLFLIAMEGKKETLDEAVFSRYIRSFQLLP